MKFYFKKISKYRNVWTKCHAGHNHQSKGEAKYCDLLHFALSKHFLKKVETQVSFDLCIGLHPITTHRVDFLLTHNDGSQEVREFKGVKMADWKIKMKLFKAIYPSIKYTVVIK